MRVGTWQKGQMRAYHAIIKHIKEAYENKQYLLLERLLNAESIQDVGEETMIFLASMDYKALVTPLVQKDLLKGLSCQACINKYGLTKEEVRNIGRNIMVYN